jgi:hypothetical protein
MALPKAQKPQDWLTQLWNIVFGSKVDFDKDRWLLGPMGEIGGIADRFIDRLAEEEQLTINRNLPDSGLCDGFEAFKDVQGLNQKIDDFYQRTCNFDLEVWTQWKPIFGSFGYLIYKLFSQRIEQLNLPQRSLDTAYGLNSEIISLKNAQGNTVYRVWYRKLKKTGEVIYSGIYNHCDLPTGDRCLKIIFPLPQGSATVILSARTDGKGNLELSSKGKRFGDPGFYFLVEDRKGTLWRHYLPSFHERIFVYEDESGAIRADHSMSLWRCKAYDLHYKMFK